MRLNEPVTQQEFVFQDELLVSTTDATGRITHCNAAFCQVSGYSYVELIGQPHNLVRHPDMPAEAFKDMWSTIGRGRPWSGIVKNRRKNGDHYWVRANVTPVMENGRPVSYISVREAASRAEIAQAEALFAQLQAQQRSGRRSVRLHAGRLRRIGWGDLPARLHRLSLTQRLAVGLATLLGSSGLAAWLWPAAGAWAPTLVALAGSGLLTLWFQRSVQRPLDQAEEAASLLASCNLRQPLRQLHPHPLSGLTRSLAQIQINLRAVIGDARSEVLDSAQTTGELARAGQNLSQRTETQASAIQRSAASMEQIAATVRQTASTAQQVAQQSQAAAQSALESGQALERVNTAFAAIEASSQRIGDIVQVIEGIAFQTNILALNAAVEAARAGEQGRGFAVVAGEVRALAQRGAAASRQVRQLIESATRQVGQSAREMDQANSTIRQTVSEVGQVGRLMNDIRHATTEQSSGISEVNQAVAALDRMTRENAAMVEQTAASVDALHQQSDTLKRSLEVFRA
jgi:aerotaxis receptor